MRQPGSQEHIVRYLPSGHRLSIRQYQFEGVQPDAPKVYIQAAVHGTEVQGSAVCALLLQHLCQCSPQAILGTINIVPMANPHGLNSKAGEHTIGPFDLATGLNWNRGYMDLSGVDPGRNNSVQAYKHLIFRRLQSEWQKIEHGASSMQRHSFTLQRQAQNADIVLDLHTSARGCRYVYGPSYARDAMRYLNATDYIALSGRFSGALDEAISCPWIKWAARFPGSEEHFPFGLTLELGDQETIDLEQAKRDMLGICALLQVRGVLSQQEMNANQSVFFGSESDFRPVFSPSGGLFQFEKHPGEEVQAGEVLGQLMRFDGERPQLESLVSPYSGRILTQYPSAICHQGIELFKILVDPQRLSF